MVASSNLPRSVPFVQKELNWVPVEQRFPVRVRLGKAPAELTRVGASAVVEIRHGAACGRRSTRNSFNISRDGLQQPERAGFTLRLALNCTLTLLVAQVYETPDPALTIYITFFLNKPDRTTSLIMNVAFVIIITILIGIVSSLPTTS